MRQEVSGMFSLGGRRGDGLKVTAQNCGRALVKPKNSLEGLCWLLNG